MPHKWTKEQREALSRKMRTLKARRRVGVNGKPQPLVHLAAKLIRMLPDEQLVKLVK